MFTIIAVFISPTGQILSIDWFKFRGARTAGIFLNSMHRVYCIGVKDWGNCFYHYWDGSKAYLRMEYDKALAP